MFVVAAAVDKIKEVSSVRLVVTTHTLYYGNSSFPHIRADLPSGPNHPHRVDDILKRIMPRQSKKLRQTTLFSIDSSSRYPASHEQNRSTRSQVYGEKADESTSDDLSAITFMPQGKAKLSNECVPSDDAESSLEKTKHTSGKARRAIYSSNSEAEEVPAASRLLDTKKSDNESLDGMKSRKRRRIRRRNHVEQESAPENEKLSGQHVSTDSLTHSSESEPPRKMQRLVRRKPMLEQDTLGTSKSSGAQTSESESVDLINEVEKERILETRMRTRVKTAFQRNLEKLKRRKFKLSNDGEQSTDQSSSDDREELSHSKRFFKGSKPSVAADEDEDEESTSGSSDFIVDDDAIVELPPEFSMETHQDLSHQFKKIFQLFVHIAVQPSSKRAKSMETLMRNEQYFYVPLQICRRNLSGLRDSLVASSVWTPGFKNSLQKYPQFDLTRLDFAVPSCDACHLGGRMSTLLGRLSGPLYNPYGFESVDPDDIDDTGVKNEFHLGRFCAKRTRVFHQFSHWEYHLFQVILQEISELRNGISSSGFYRISYGGKEPPTDLDDADGLCDWLDKRKIIDTEWQTMKAMMESARHLELEKNDVDD